MQVFYVNIGGGEPTVRPDFWELVDYATEHHVGVKFSTNGVKITPEVARRLAGSDYVDVQISLDGATAEVNDAVRGRGSYDTAMRAMQNLADAGFRGLQDLRRHDAAERRPARRVQGHRRPLRRPAAHHPAAAVRSRRRRLGRAARHRRRSSASSTTGWSPTARTCSPATRSSTSPRSATRLPGLNLCGAGRVVCLIDPVGDVYACPFAIHDNFLAGNVRADGGFAAVWRTRTCSSSCASRRPAARAARARPSTPAAAAAWRPSSSPACRSTGPTPSASRATASGPCSHRRGQLRPSRRWTTRTAPAVRLSLTARPDGAPAHAGHPSACDENPLAGLALAGDTPLAVTCPRARRPPGPWPT